MPARLSARQAYLRYFRANGTIRPFHTLPRCVFDLIRFPGTLAVWAVWEPDPTDPEKGRSVTIESTGIPAPPYRVDARKNIVSHHQPTAPLGAKATT